MTKFKYIGAHPDSIAGKNVAICFNDGTITVDVDHTCECPPALQEVLDNHPDFERLSPAKAPAVQPEPKPKAQPKPAPVAEAKAEPKVVEKTVVKQEVKQPEPKTDTTPRRRRTRKASK